MQANGGHLWHVIEIVQEIEHASALCGFTPQSHRARRMQPRSGWKYYSQENPKNPKDMRCTKCSIKLSVQRGKEGRML